jgi:hypothetical protein
MGKLVCHSGDGFLWDEKDGGDDDDSGDECF